MGSQKMQTKYEILTPDGWSDFHGVRKQITPRTIVITFDNTTVLECTHEHQVECKWGFDEAKNLNIGDDVKTDKGFARITFICKNRKSVPVYDALHVEKQKKYYTNGIVSHNCQFLGSSGTLISGSKLKELAFSQPIIEKDGIYQYERPEKDRVYFMAVDVSR